MIYALIMCLNIGTAYETCNLVPQSDPQVYSKLEDCRYYEAKYRAAFANSVGVKVECREKKLEQWEVVK